MRNSNGFVVCLTVAVLTISGLTVSGAQAQSLPGVDSAGSAMSGMTGGMGNMASGAMGSMLPNVSSASMGNVAGVLSYCVQNNYLNGSGATSALGSLTGKQDVTSSSDYTAGQQGQLLTGGDNPFSLSSLTSGIKKKVCNMVLDRAKNLI